MRTLLILSIALCVFGVLAQTPPLPPGYKPATRAPRQINTGTGLSMSRATAVIPATNAPTALVIRGWSVRDGVLCPWLALRLNTNAPKLTIYTINDPAHAKCRTTMNGGMKGDLIDFGYCSTTNNHGTYRVVIHD